MRIKFGDDGVELYDLTPEAIGAVSKQGLAEAIRMELSNSPTPNLQELNTKLDAILQLLQSGGGTPPLVGKTFLVRLV